MTRPCRRFRGYLLRLFRCCLSLNTLERFAPEPQRRCTNGMTRSKSSSSRHVRYNPRTARYNPTTASRLTAAVWWQTQLRNLSPPPYTTAQSHLSTVVKYRGQIPALPQPDGSQPSQSRPEETHYLTAPLFCPKLLQTEASVFSS